MMIKYIIGTVGLCMTLFSYTAIATTAYVFNSAGKITGATGIEVSGSLYDLALHTNITFDDLYAQYPLESVVSWDFSFAASTAFATFYYDNYLHPSNFLGGGVSSMNITTGHSYYEDAHEIRVVELNMYERTPVYDDYWFIEDTVDYSDVNIDSYIGPSALATWSSHIETVPVPAAVWLFGSGLLGLIGVARRKTA